MKYESRQARERFQRWGERVILKRMNRSKGPRAWCNKCSRYHRRGEVCRLYLRTRTAKSGKKVKVWAH